jgi:hypothetical protein
MHDDKHHAGDNVDDRPLHHIVCCCKRIGMWGLGFGVWGRGLGFRVVYAVAVILFPPTRV